MVKQNIKVFSFLLVGLFIMGLTGLFMGLAQVNRFYVQNTENLNVLVDEVLRLEKVICGNTQKLMDYDFMKFKVNAFSRRYAVFGDILDAVYHKSNQYGFEPNLVLGIVKVESGFNPNAISYVGACGLMQVNLPVWRKELAIDDERVFDVAYNVDLGLQILRRYYDESGGNMKRALHLYNNGYLYNNTAYAGKVDTAMQTFTSTASPASSKMNLATPAPAYTP